MTDRVSAGPYTLDIPPNGVAILYEDGKQRPGGVGYLEALIEFAGEVIRLRERCAQSDVDILIETGRNEALEEAATTCLRKARDYVIPIGQDNYHDGCISCAAAIRALKGRR